MPTTEQIRQTVLNLYQSEREAWLCRAREIIRGVIVEKGRATADDIHERLPIPNGIDPRIVGSVFRGMHCIGYEKSKRKINHGRPIGVFTA